MTLRVDVAADLAPCLAIRRAVFMDEQNVPEALARAGHDADALHLLATLDGRPVGTLRIVTKGRAGKVGRVAVLRDSRGRGIGAALMARAVEECWRMGLARVSLGSQVHAVPFYERLGFAAFGPEYDDAGIPHRDMALEL